MALIDKLTSIADAIRQKRDIVDEMTLDDMPMQIGLIDGGGEAPTFVVQEDTADGTYGSLTLPFDDSFNFFVGRPDGAVNTTTRSMFYVFMFINHDRNTYHALGLYYGNQITALKQGEIMGDSVTIQGGGTTRLNNGYTWTFKKYNV